MKNGEFTDKKVLELVKESYERGDAGFDIIPEKCALLVIDMQDEFVKPNWTPYWVPDATRQVPQIKDLIEQCRLKDIPVIFTVYSNTHNYLDRPKYLTIMPCRFPDLDIEFASNLNLAISQAVRLSIASGVRTASIKFSRKLNPSEDKGDEISKSRSDDFAVARAFVCFSKIPCDSDSSSFLILLT